MRVLLQYQEDFSNICYVANESNHIKKIALSSLNELRDYQLIVIVPGTKLHVFFMKTPPMSETELKKAVPHMLEDSLSQDIELLHFEISEPRADKKRFISVVEKTIWDRWMQDFQNHALSPDIMIPDYLCLPYESSCWTLYCNDQNALIRTSFEEGTSIALPLLETFLSSRFVEAEIKPQKIKIIYETHKPNITFPENISIEYSSGSFEKMISSQHLAKNFPLNFAPKKYKHSKTKPFMDAWKRCGLVFLILIGTAFLGQLILALYFNMRSVFVDHEIINFYKQLSNEQVPASADLVWRTQTLLKPYHHNPNPFINVLNKVSPLLSRFPQIQISDIHYVNHQLTLTLNAKTTTDFENFNRALSLEKIDVLSVQAHVMGAAATQIIEIGAY